MNFQHYYSSLQCLNVICLFDALETFFVLFFIDVENGCAAIFILKTVMHFIFFDEYKDEYIIDLK